MLFSSNFWFVDDFDLTKKFSNNPKIVAADVMIASCLKIDPNERCNYDQLINMMNSVLKEAPVSADAERQHLVEVAMEKQKVIFAEKLAQNKHLVNLFRVALLESLHGINEKYPTITL